MSNPRSFLLFALVWLISYEARAQVTVLRPVDISGGFESGACHVAIYPSYDGDTLKVFDGNQFSALEMQNSDTLAVTVRSDSLISIERSVVYFWTSGTWTLELADSESDLETKTGSYARPVDGRNFSAFSWDSVTFPRVSAHVMRLSVKNPSSSFVILGEWALEGSVTFTKLVILPRPIFLLPGTSLQLSVKMLDEQSRVYSYFLTEPLSWVSGDRSIATIDEYGRLTGLALGTTTVTVEPISKSISGTAALNVVTDFHPQKVVPMNVKVALVIEDPAISTQGYQRIHEIFRWRDPQLLVKRLIFHFLEASDSVTNFQIVETHDDNKLFTHYWDTVLTENRYYQLLSEPGWKSLKAAADSGKLWFDYREMVKYYGFDRERNSGQIDEVWVYAGPYLAMYESQLMGPKAFWWNSPPIRDGTDLHKLLSVMGLNYERGVDMAFHSFGHRFESAMSQAYFEAQGLDWNPKRLNPTPWDLFTRIDKDMPGQAHVGNIHYPPNGTHDYDYGNSKLVKSYAQNWLRYPYLLDQTSEVNVSTWIYSSEQYPNGDPLAEGQDHLGYLRWWYNHLPRYVGVTEGVLNNWWHYALDYEGAVELAKQTVVVRVDNGHATPIPVSTILAQNYPNPFNPATNIEYRIADCGFVTLKVYDVLGREVTTLVKEMKMPGTYVVKFDASGLPSGVYFYRLQTGTYHDAKKLLLLK